MQIFIAGNGAQAALSQHLACDLLKGCSTPDAPMNAISLASNMALMTAISNDIDYSDVFLYQLERQTTLASTGLLVLLSASGSSQNVVRAAKFARAHRPSMRVLSLTGFDGEPLRELSDVNVHVESYSYEVVEDVHAAIAHAWVVALKPERPKNT